MVSYVSLLAIKRFGNIDLIPAFVQPLLTRWGMLLALIIALTSTLGSLYFSELQGFAPCLLCWYQRIFMYPLVFIILISIMTKDRKASRYILPLVGFGGIIAALHVYIQTFPTSVISCTFNDVSCSDNYFTYFGFITIPVMSLVSFVVIGLLTVLSNSGQEGDETRVA
ncbi:disulfide bond formation protein B [candidate division WWE3 bacterium]|uniref:Disulfide bond formation protein B n=1 Tax=candidate division WWE3 bacterium TaxID=2053526 RepID=A0A955LL46_UNCKA|nr:disulfide bond formation protein B [candidate division WWE3 bacterium]